MRNKFLVACLAATLAVSQAACCTIWKRTIQGQKPAAGRGSGGLDLPCFALGNGALFIFGAGILGLIGVVVDLSTDEAYLRAPGTSLLPGAPEEMPEAAKALTLVFADGRALTLAGLRPASFLDKATHCARLDAGDGDIVAHAWHRESPIPGR